MPKGKIELSVYVKNFWISGSDHIFKRHRRVWFILYFNPVIRKFQFDKFY